MVKEARLRAVLVAILLACIFPGQATALRNADRHGGSYSGPTPGLVRLSKVLIESRTGLATDTEDEILAACRHADYPTRESALCVLADSLGEKAIPRLKEALNDPELSVRREAARLLRLKGDTSGLARMQKDFASLAPDGGMSDPNLSNLKGDELEIATKVMRERRYRALEVALVLAELEDHSGYELAAKMALDEDELPGKRHEAIEVLAEIAIDGRAALIAENRDPEPIFIAVAESETNPRVLQRLAQCVTFKDVEADTVIKVLRILRTSPHMLEKDREFADREFARHTRTNVKDRSPSDTKVMRKTHEN